MRLILLALLFISQAALADVWTSENNWDSKWEKAYSAWVKTYWTNDVFIRPGGLLFGIKTDCAEATYTMRATYAYLNHLEFAAHAADTRTQQRVINNHLKSFDSEIDADKRFRKFIVYLLQRVNSTSLAVDTYPVHIDREHFVPGIIYVAPGEHSFQIVDLSDTGIPTVLNSTTPAQARLLFHAEGFPFYLPRDFNHHLDGYRAFREPKDLETPINQLSQAGFEQYEDSKIASESYFKFTDRMLSRLALRPENENEKIKRNFTNLCFYSRERAPRVIEAYLLWNDGGRKCLSSGDFYGHSTFDRDEQLKDYFLAVKSLSEGENFGEVSGPLREEILNIFSGSQIEGTHSNNLPDLNPRVSNTKSTCVVEVGVPQKPILSLREVWQLIQNQKLVSDPNATILQRWGQEAFVPICR